MSTQQIYRAPLRLLANLWVLVPGEAFENKQEDRGAHSFKVMRVQGQRKTTITNGVDIKH